MEWQYSPDGHLYNVKSELTLLCGGKVVAIGYTIIHVRNWLSPLLGLNREKIANFIPTADILIACANLCASDVYRAIDKICNTLNCSTCILT